METGISVCIVEDEESIIDGVRRVVETLDAQARFHAVLVETGDDARRVPELVAEYRPEVLIMDLGLPYMEPVSAPWEPGLRLLDAIASMLVETVPIALTAYEPDAALADALRAGALRYVVKRGSWINELRQWIPLAAAYGQGQRIRREAAVQAERMAIAERLAHDIASLLTVVSGATGTMRPSRRPVPLRCSNEASNG